jgi:hypothetical protein
MRMGSERPIPTRASACGEASAESARFSDSRSVEANAQRSRAPMARRWGNQGRGFTMSFRHCYRPRSMWGSPWRPHERSESSWLCSPSLRSSHSFRVRRAPQPWLRVPAAKSRSTAGPTILPGWSCIKIVGQVSSPASVGDALPWSGDSVECSPVGSAGACANVEAIGYFWTTPTITDPGTISGTSSCGSSLSVAVTFDRGMNKEDSAERGPKIGSWPLSCVIEWTLTPDSGDDWWIHCGGNCIRTDNNLRLACPGD